MKNNDGMRITNKVTLALEWVTMIPSLVLMNFSISSASVSVWRRPPKYATIMITLKSRNMTTDRRNRRDDHTFLTSQYGEEKAVLPTKLSNSSFENVFAFFLMSVSKDLRREVTLEYCFKAKLYLDFVTEFSILYIVHIVDDAIPFSLRYFK